MPIYEYRCLHCGRNFDLSHSVGADPGPCPWCRGLVRRVFSSVGVIFKGSGFHSTDYRKPAPKEEGASKESTPERTSKTPKESAGEGSRKGSASDGTTS